MHIDEFEPMVTRLQAVVQRDGAAAQPRLAEALLLDDETVRDWFKLYDKSGVGGLTRFEVGGNASQLCKA